MSPAARHPAPEAVLALDQGTHASRACVFARDGRLLAEHHVPVALRLPAADRAEQDPHELEGSLRAAATVALAAARARSPALRVLGAGLAVQRSTLVCAEGPACEPIGPALSWQDRRHAAWLAPLAPQAARVRELTGLPLSAHYGASKLRWCLEHVPEVARAARRGTLRALPLAAWLQARLAGGAPGAGSAGTPACDVANASRTLLLDTARLAWSRELLELFGLAQLGLGLDALPALLPTTGDFGMLALGGERIALRALTGDQSAVPWSDGVASRAATLVLGTGAFLQAPLGSRPADPAPLLGSVLGLWSGTALYSLEGTINGAGAAVSAFCARERLEEPGLWPALEALPDEADLPEAVVAVGGLGSPWWQPGARGGWPEGGTPLTRFAAVLDAVATLVAVNVAAFDAAGARPGALRVAGGLSRSGWLCRRLAAFTGRPVQRLPAEATARGVAALAAPEWAQAWGAAGATHGGPPEAWPAPQDGLARRLAERRDRLAAGYAALAAACAAPATGR